MKNRRVLITGMGGELGSLVAALAEILEIVKHFGAGDLPTTDTTVELHAADRR